MVIKMCVATYSKPSSDLANLQSIHGQNAMATTPLKVPESHDVWKLLEKSPNLIRQLPIYVPYLKIL